MKRITILHLRKSEGYYGAERIILSLAGHFNNSHWKSMIGCLYDRRYPMKELYESAKEKGIHSVLIPCRYRLDLKSIFYILKVIRKNRIDIIHCHGFKADVFGWFGSTIMKIPVVATKHGWTHANVLIRIWEKLDLLFLRRFDSIATVTDLIRKELIHNIIRPTRISTIPNGISIPCSIQPNPKISVELGLQNNDLVVGLIGRLSIEKGHAFFLKAAQEIVKEVPCAKFIIVGGGSLRKELEDLTLEMGLTKQVHFTGFRDDVEEILKRVDVMASTSLREGVPVTLLEAMAFKRPIVATSVGGVKGLIHHGVNGYLVQSDDIRTFVSCTIQLLRDPVLRKRFGDASQRIVHEQFSIEKMAEEYKKIYHKVYRDANG